MWLVSAANSTPTAQSGGLVLGFTLPAFGFGIGFRFVTSFLLALMRDGDCDEPRVASRFFLGPSRGLEQGIALGGAFAPGDGSQGIEVFAEPTATSGPLFFDAVATLGEDVGFILRWQEFDSHAGPGLLPRAKSSPEGERSESIHHPDAVGFAILVFDLGEEAIEGGLVGQRGRSNAG